MTTYVMKIGSETQAYSAATFDFSANSQQNPNLVDVSMDVQRKIFEVMNQIIQGISDLGGMKPRAVVLDGKMHGTAANRLTALRGLAAQVYTTGVKRIWLDSDTFIFAFGAGMKNTFNNRQLIFVPFRTAWVCPIPLVYKPSSDGDEFATTWTIANATATTINTANKTSGDDFGNAGNAPAHIYKWTITNIGAADITKVEIGDLAVAAGPIVAGTNKITINLAAGELAQNEVLIIYLFKVDNGYLKKLYWEVDGVNVGTRDFDGTDSPQIAANTAAPDFSIKLTGNNGNTTVKAEWYDSYWV